MLLSRAPSSEADGGGLKWVRRGTKFPQPELPLGRELKSSSTGPQEVLSSSLKARAGVMSLDYSQLSN